MSRSENLPLIADEQLDAIRALEKPVPDIDWRDDLLAPQTIDGANLKARYYLPKPLEARDITGTLFVFTRVRRSDPRNFTAGLALHDDEQREYRLIRCNGHHGEHENHLEGEVIPAATPHIHLATERYTQVRRHFHDTFATVTDEYDDLPGALACVARMARLVPEGRMFL